jgi:Zn ribbon nucleic-acid-binding protein
MPRLVATKVHMRCTREVCKKRFKGLAVADAVCPDCGARAKADVWAAKKEWRNSLCYCDGYSWSIKGAPHHIGRGACNYNEANQQPTETEHDHDLQ